MLKKKSIDCELDLISFISLLAVLISALLLTAVWLHIGSMTVKQSVGGAPKQTKEKPKPILWAHISTNGHVSLRVERARGIPRRLQSFSAPKRNIEKVQNYLERLRKVAPKFNMAFVKPVSGTYYEDIILVMDALKSKGWTDLGVHPL